MTMRSILLASALILSAAVPARAAGDNVVLIDVSKVNVPSSLPGRCQVNGIVNQVWQGKTFRPGEAITITVPCSAADSGRLTPAVAVPGLGPHFIAADVLRFALLWLMAVLGLAVVYRYAPARERARWRWVTWGSVMAATLWMGATALFAVYVKDFRYGQS